uniref:Uncharacterized protein n=1 Tax=Trieres chinensis TaxID=1514140 RepID=A0A7S2AA18_TRICV|mmetsp:Transcript_7315/g.15490  ORF Transcript_7315/g.15490 Transcript_7315/m.15490 type:complete len:169 (+) Transcript_7315:593-1099(+)
MRAALMSVPPSHVGGGGAGAGGAGAGGGKGGATAARSAAERNTNVSEARGTEEGGAGGGTSSSLLLLKKWSLVLLTRFLLSPSLMYGLLVVSSRIGLVRRSEDDPFLWFALLLEASMPPAQNQVVMLQVADRAEAAGEMAKFLFLTYASSMVPVVLILTWTLQRLGLA